MTIKNIILVDCLYICHKKTEADTYFLINTSEFLKRIETMKGVCLKKRNIQQNKDERLHSRKEHQKDSG